MPEIEEDDGWADAFVGTYANSRNKVEARHKAERRAGMTAKQRGRVKATPKKQLNVRVKDETHALIERLCRDLYASQVEVVELAIAELAGNRLRREGKS